MTLLSFTSKQIWPQVLATVHYRPTRLVLFQTDEERESKEPAKRLREFFESGAVPDAPAVELRQAPHDRFKDIVDALAGAAEEFGLDHGNCEMNLTGGNKLMALAAAEWCRLAGVPCFYLERDLRLIPFEAKGADLLPQPDFKLDPHLARAIHPLALLRCQLGGAGVTFPGQTLTLNERGSKLPEAEVGPMIKRGESFEKFMAWDVEIQEKRAGDSLELESAFVLLKLGVPRVQRGVKLAPKTIHGFGPEEGELDLVFNWLGKLWVVDCKNRRTAAQKVDAIRTEVLLSGPLSNRLSEMLRALEGEIRERDLHPLKQDLLSVSEVGGVLGQAICVRSNPLPCQAADFAKSRRIPVTLRESLLGDLRVILYPNQPASAEQLRALAAARTLAVVEPRA